jgi:hypothetical protein
MEILIWLDLFCSSATRRVTPSDMWVLRLSLRRRRRSKKMVQKRHEIRLGARIANGAADFTRDDIERSDQGFCAMADILELPPFDVAGLHRQPWGGALQRLNTGHLVDRNGLHVLFGGGWSRLIHRADIGALGVDSGSGLGVSQ